MKSIYSLFYQIFSSKNLLFIQEETEGSILADATALQEGFESSWDRLWDRMSGWKDALINHLPEIALAIIVFFTCYFLSIYAKRFTNKYLQNSVKKTSVRSLISNLVSIILVMTGLMISISILNLGDIFNGLLAAGGIAGLAVGLALQGTLANTFSGIFLSLNDMMNVGDWVETNGYEGEVVEINLRNTRIREPDNNIVVIPNKTIIDHPFKNFGLTHRIRITLKCGIEYKYNLREIKDIATEAIKKKFPPLLSEKIEFHWLQFGESSIDFQIRFWISGNKKVILLEAHSEAMMVLKEAFDKNEINIPFPIRTLEFTDKSLFKS
ncbi:MAG: mechanosensitive ion channel family protein [Moheibacter sp.]